MLNVNKYRADINMLGVKFETVYRQQKFSIVLFAKRKVQDVQRSHSSYNVPATISIFERQGNEWVFDEDIEIGVLERK